MPEFSAISHVSFSVRDADKTAQWWRDVFGLDDATAIEHETWRAILLFLTPQIAIEFQEHRANKGEEFDPTRTGFDHMGLKVDSLAELEAWQTHFEEKGVEHTPIVEKDYGDGPTYVLTFKDPDRIQFEMFHWEHHP
jgi:glyoxylase I family protein